MEKDKILELFYGIVCALLVLSLFFLLIYGGSLYESKESEKIRLQIELEMLKKYYSCDNINNISPKEQELESFLLSLDRLNKNCGETFITKRYGSNEWAIFTALNENQYQLVKDCY